MSRVRSPLHTPNLQVTWAFEPSTINMAIGQSDFTVSDVRSSFLVTGVQTLQSDMRDVKKSVSQGAAYQAHGSGSGLAARFVRRAMSALEGQARTPVALTYRVVGSVQAAKEFADYHTMYSSLNHFKVHLRVVVVVCSVYISV